MDPSETSGVGMVAVAETTAGAAVEPVEVVGAGTEAAHATTAGAATIAVATCGAGTLAVAATIAGATVAPAPIVGAGTAAVPATTAGVAVASVAPDVTPTVKPMRCDKVSDAVNVSALVADPEPRIRVANVAAVMLPALISACSVNPAGGVNVFAPDMTPATYRSSRSADPAGVMPGVLAEVSEPVPVCANVGVDDDAPLTAAITIVICDALLFVKV
ncbi:hypothetical protein [Streptosporangium sp. CA-115845]|uniref:hypothetical protein n=1 Tax=Streptosporangium sp. CA-115845 TaxID=3240071 RepID=UPI003D8D3948